MSSIRPVVVALFCVSLALPVYAADTAAEDEELDALLDVGPAGGSGGGSGMKLSGYGELGGAYTYAEDDRWSRLRARLELSASGRLGERSRWKLSARGDADGAFDLEDAYYPSAVRHDQRNDAILREAWVDFGAGDWEFRLGRQHIIWGEMVGFFFADVVSARDMRDFLLPELETIRIAQWAARAEYYGGDTHFEMVWVPSPSYDDIGKPGSDFYPYPQVPAGTPVTQSEPADSLSNSNWGLRVSRLVGGWDMSAFYYRSNDISPTLGFNPATQGLELNHDRIRQIGGTFSKDMGSFVFKGEAVHTRGRSLNTLQGGMLGLAPTGMVDYALGIDVPVQDVWRFNMQYFARWLDDHDDRMAVDREERGMTFQVVRELGSTVELEFLAASSLNRSDYMLRPKATWKFAPEWRAVAGVDVFHGPDEGLFGRFADRDRVYMEVRRWF